MKIGGTCFCSAAALLVNKNNAELDLKYALVCRERDKKTFSEDGRDLPDLDESIAADGQKQHPLDVQVHEPDAALHIVETRQRHFFVVADRKLVASERKWTFFGRAAITNCFAASTAVVLPEADLLLVVHCPQVPKEGPAAQLAGVGLRPLGSFEPPGGHVPQHEVRILAD